MIQEFVDRFIGQQDAIKYDLYTNPPKSYEDLVERLITVLATEDYCGPDPERITIINHGDYQGTLLFIIGEKGYQPNTYWSIMVNYGSCSGCDSFQSINDHFYNDDTADECEEYMEKEVDGNWHMMLHMVQSMKLIGEDYGYS